MSSLEGEPTEYEWDNEDEELEVLSNSKADFVYWSKMPFWTLEEGIVLLLGRDPELAKWKIVQHYVNYSYSTDFCSAFYKLRNLSLRAVERSEIKEPCSPIDFLNWAKGRDIYIPEELWRQVVNNPTVKGMDWAEKLSELNKLLEAKDEKISTLEEQVIYLQEKINKLEPLVWEGFDERSSTYAEELAIAIKAYQIISKQWKKGSSIKQQIFEWLQKEYPKMSKEKKERIATVCNWQKAGGAPCTP